MASNDVEIGVARIQAAVELLTWEDNHNLHSAARDYLIAHFRAGIKALEEAASPAQPHAMSGVSPLIDKSNELDSLWKRFECSICHTVVKGFAPLEGWISGLLKGAVVCKACNEADTTKSIEAVKRTPMSLAELDEKFRDYCAKSQSDEADSIKRGREFTSRSIEREFSCTNCKAVVTSIDLPDGWLFTEHGEQFCSKCRYPVEAVKPQGREFI